MKNWASLLFLAAAPLPGSESVLINVVVADYAGIPLAIMREAEADAGKLLRHAGIEADWHYRDRRSSNEWTDTDEFWTLFVNILPPTMAAKTPVDGSCLGYAHVTSPGNVGVLAAVLYGRVERFSEQHPRMLAKILGHVIAHEIGHLLGASHDSVGLMKSPWSPREMLLMQQGRLVFSGPQKKQVRKNVSVVLAMRQAVWAALNQARENFDRATLTSRDASREGCSAAQDPVHLQVMCNARDHGTPAESARGAGGPLLLDAP